ncbi:hypothetical protein BDZ89DRAFT_296697 [Hymenopellis radicata]|nr:hypothetical protein BDZ89DRAFT_296697 [Hymenopellis radicata]
MTKEPVKWAKFVAQVIEEYPEMNEYEACWPLEVYYDNWVYHWRPPKQHQVRQKPSEYSAWPAQGPKSQAQPNLPTESGPSDMPMFHPQSVNTHPERASSASTTDSSASSHGKERLFVLPLLKPLPLTPWKIARLPPEEDVHLVPSTSNHKRLASLMMKSEEEYWELKMMLKFLFEDYLDVTLEKAHWCEVDEIQWRSFVNAACHKDSTLLEYEDLWPVEFCIRPYMQQD